MDRPDPEFIEAARQLHPTMSFEVMSARKMTYPDNRFDGSIAVMALSAMLDTAVVDDALSEMCRSAGSSS